MAGASACTNSECRFLEQSLKLAYSQSLTTLALYDYQAAAVSEIRDELNVL